MIAMALSCNPILLIADEPTTALDVTTQAQILDLMRHLQREYGMAIMLITHDLGVVAEMVDDVVVMYLGRVVEQASVDDIFYAPKHPYTQALLRSILHIRSKSRERLASLSGFVSPPTIGLQAALFIHAVRPLCLESVTGGSPICSRLMPHMR
jgi:peptide/nickel transport system ATP-binding protein